MPVKRRIPKRRFSPAAELAAWDCMFEFGRDYFRELDDLGLGDLRAAARESWHRLGSLFLATRQPDPHRPEPWALLTFGEPRAR